MKGSKKFQWVPSGSNKFQEGSIGSEVLCVRVNRFPKGDWGVNNLTTYTYKF